MKLFELDESEDGFVPEEFFFRFQASRFLAWLRRL